MLVLFESSAGYALFKLKHGEKLLQETEDIYQEFEDNEKISKRYFD